MGAVISVENVPGCGCVDSGVKMPGLITSQPEPQALRCCLPQFDPFREQRTHEVQESTLLHPLVVERQVPNEDKENKGMHYKTCPNGLPFDFTLPPWENLLPHIKDARGYLFQVEEVIREYMGTAGEAILRMGPDHPKQNFTSFGDCNMYKEPGKGTRGFPKVERVHASHWATDDEFARCRLTGTHPLFIRVVVRRNQIPSHFAITDELLLGLMEQFETIDDAIKMRRLHLIDYSELLFLDPPLEEPPEDGEERPPRRNSNAHLCNPIVLFYKTNSGKLLPVAIQLWGKVTDRFTLYHYSVNPVYTPQDNLYAWMMAKLYFTSADMHVHLLISLCTHIYLLTAAFHLFEARNLSINHPIRQMLSPHTRLSVTAFERIMSTLISDNGPLQGFLCLDGLAIRDLVCRMWRKFDFNNKAFAHDVKDRTDDSSLLGYNFIEDGKAWWRHIYTYVKHVLSCYYSCSDDMDDDDELQQWFHEMTANINRMTELHPARREEPVAFNITSLIFTTTVMHTALTHNMYDYYSNVAAFPGCFRVNETCQKNRDSISLQDLVGLLPNKRAALLQIATAYVLSGKNNPLMGSQDFGKGIAEKGFKDKRLQASVDAFFTTKLEELRQEIIERNNSSSTHYTCLMPGNVRNNYAS